MGKPQVLVSWVSIEHAAAPILTVLDHAEAQLGGPIAVLYLCHRSPGDEKGRSALAQTRAELGARYPQLAIEVVHWKTSGPPTDHAALLAFSKETLQRVRAEHPDAVIDIHLSPGTKSMHAVWLILAHGAFIKGQVRLLQTTDAQHRRRGQPAIELVRLPQETWAHIVRASTPSDPGEDVDGSLWDPPSLTSPAARRLIDDIGRWAPVRAPLLLVGERGTGKTTLAHAVRARSPFRSNKKEWPVVVCGQFRANPQLARSELFGHKKGAFTDATEDRDGVLARVNNDTLFLDEIADLDRTTQRLLIAAIEGRGFHRLGDNKRITANFRLITATNRPLAQLVGDNGIDPDFYDRIATFVVHVPPLRQRREDIPALWRSVLTRAARGMALDAGELDAFERDRTMRETLESHPLPGNLRDLQRVAWYGLAALQAGLSAKKAASEALRALKSDLGATAARSLGFPIDLGEHLAIEERALIERALEEAGGNKSKAADLLKVPRKTLDYKLEKLGLTPR